MRGASYPLCQAYTPRTPAREKNHGVKIDFEELGYDDAEVYKLIGTGETEAVFQLESAGMKGFLKNYQPQNLEEVIAGISLYRLVIAGPLRCKGTWSLMTSLHITTPAACFEQLRGKPSVYNVPLDIVNSTTKLIPNTPGVTLDTETLSGLRKRSKNN